MRELPAGGSAIARGHRVDQMLNGRTSPETSSFQFRETLVHHALRFGNGYAEIVPDQIGRPMEMYPLHPTRVEVCRALESTRDVYGDEIAEGGLFYEVSGSAGKVTLSPKRIFHLRGLGDDGPVGVSVLDFAAQSIGWALAAQLFGASFFGNGMNIGGVVTNKVPLSPEGLEQQKAEVAAAHRGPGKAFGTLFLDSDSTYEPLAPDMASAQFLELTQHLVEEQCRWFGGVPPHKVQHLLRATFTNIEHQSIEVVTDVLLPWCLRLEAEADYKLLGAADRGMWTSINMRGLLRGDFKSQNEGLKIARDAGVINADEWRALLDQPPMLPGDGGDKYLVQAAQIELKDVGRNFAPTP